MKQNKTLLFAATFALCGQLLAEVPKVSNIRASQLDGTKIVEILYDVEDAENDKLTIRIEISADGGERYNVPARTFEGAVGANIDPGKDKKITWNAGLDWDGEFSDKMRVRITASDGKGLPGLEWSKEIPPGGFLMGQDGGPEGSGPNTHINVSYSYWITKHKITNSQYCDFLNVAHAAGKSTSKAKLKSFFTVTQGNNPVIDLSDSHFIRWNINKFELLRGGEFAALVTWNGAKAFAEFYGYDLPTEIEWEKAARGLNDDAGEHTKYQWGNDDSPENRELWARARPVGWFNGINTVNDVVNDYGIYDIRSYIEWTKTTPIDLEAYPRVTKKPNRYLKHTHNSAFIIRGESMIWQRNQYSNQNKITFRLVRRD
ncbi:formylglycine-generating enzyme family protein [bacterium]|nr:formylglycine-generating enzyme family protein [bacterium]